MGDTPISRPNTAGITAASATWVILDNTSEEIEYVGNWDSITASPQINTIGYFGPTFRDTLHRLTGRGSLTYQFQGTAVQVSGTIINKPGDPLTRTNCFVDGVKHETLILDNFEANNFPYCEILDLKDGQHTLNVTFSVPSGHTAWIDKLAYIPSPSVDLSNALVQVDNSDPMIKYDSYWQDMTLTRWTHSNGSQAIIDFAGTSLVWYSVSFPSQDGVLPESRATWTIDDDREEHTIIVPARRPSDPDPHYNEPILNITNLTPSRHRLKVIRRSNSSAEPLYLDYLQIQMVPVPDLPSTTASGTPGATNTSSSGNIDDGSSGLSALSTGAEIGIGIGAAVAVVLLAFLTLFLYRRYKREYQQVDVSILRPPPMSAIENHSSTGNIASASPMSASTHFVSHPSSTHETRPSNEPIISVDPHNLLTNGHRYDENDGEEPQSPSHTEDLPRYSMHFTQGTATHGP